MDKLHVAPINDVDKPSAVSLCSTMPVDKSVDKLPVNNSSVAMTNDVADKPVDKPSALLSWPRSTVPGTTIVRDFLPLAAAGPVSFVIWISSWFYSENDACSVYEDVHFGIKDKYY